MLRTLGGRQTSDFYIRLPHKRCVTKAPMSTTSASAGNSVPATANMAASTGSSIVESAKANRVDSSDIDDGLRGGRAGTGLDSLRVRQ